MSISDRTSPRKPSVPWPHLGEMTWLGAIALTIVAVHVLAASLVMPASRGPAALFEDARASFTD